MCDDAALWRWVCDDFRFAPYVYQEKYLLRHRSSQRLHALHTSRPRRGTTAYLADEERVLLVLNLGVRCVVPPGGGACPGFADPSETKSLRC